MNRRELLAMLALGGLAGLNTACGGSGNNASASTGKQKKIVVIGAGLSGLAAARELQQQGHEVVVLEARQRIGGRIWTSRRWADLPLDFGASWIHGISGNPLTDLANEIRAKRVVTRYNSAITYNTSGKPLTAAQESRLENLSNRVFARIEQAQNGAKDISVRQAVQPILNQFSPSSQDYRFVNFILSGSIEQEYSGSTSQLSTYWYDNAEVFAGNDALFEQGYAVIPQFLAKGLTIKKGQVVKEIRWQQSPVRVITQNSEFTADHVVVTLPLGVLQAKRVTFTPALPQGKQKAIASLGMGVLNKCYLRFAEAFWPKNVDWLEYIPVQHGEWTEWVSFQQAVNKPVLLGFNAADRGRQIEAWSDTQIVDSAMKTLRTIFGAAIPDPVDYQLTRWASDPYALGSYSFNALGSTPNMRKVLAAPLQGKLFFAGEATETGYFGTAHGAYLSGLRAATDVLLV